MKTIKLDQLLQWAFVNELSKGGGADGINGTLSAWHAIEGVSLLGTRIDLSRGRQDLPTFLEQGEPDEDAVLVGKAVKDIINHDFWPLTLDITHPAFKNWPSEIKTLAKPLLDDVLNHYYEKGQKQRSKSIIALVIRSAILGAAPCHALPVPKMALVTRMGKPCWFLKQIRQDAFGQMVEFEIDGYDNKTKRPKKNAYRKYQLNPCPKANIASFIDYLLWHAAKLFLYNSLNGKLAKYRLISPQIVKSNKKTSA